MATCTTTESAFRAAPTRCPDIVRLRQEARQLQEKLRTSQQRARQHQGQDRRSGERPRSHDYEFFLQRKIMKNCLQIARHIAEHGCEQLGRDD